MKLRLLDSGGSVMSIEPSSLKPDQVQGPVFLPLVSPSAERVVSASCVEYLCNDSRGRAGVSAVTCRGWRVALRPYTSLYCSRAAVKKKSTNWVITLNRDFLWSRTTVPLQGRPTNRLSSHTPLSYQVSILTVCTPVWISILSVKWADPSQLFLWAPPRLTAQRGARALTETLDQWARRL